MCFHMFLQMFQVFHLSTDVCCKMFCLDVSKVDLVLHMLQWRGGWRTAACRRALAPTRATRLTLSSPSPPFPSLHLVSALALGWGLLRVLRSDAGASVGWDAGRRDVGCDAGTGTGATSGHCGRTAGC